MLACFCISTNIYNGIHSTTGALMNKSVHLKSRSSSLWICYHVVKTFCWLPSPVTQQPPDCFFFILQKTVMTTVLHWVQTWAKFLRIFAAETFLWVCIMHTLFTPHWECSIIKVLKWHMFKNLNTLFCQTCAPHCSSYYPSLTLVGDVSYSNFKRIQITLLSHRMTKKR